MTQHTVERTTKVQYDVHIGWDEGKLFDTLKEARVHYKKCNDDFDGVHLSKIETEVTTIVTTTSLQNK
jgi:hypothetical protein